VILSVVWGYRILRIATVVDSIRAGVAVIRKLIILYIEQLLSEGKINHFLTIFITKGVPRFTDNISAAVAGNFSIIYKSGKRSFAVCNTVMQL